MRKAVLWGLILTIGIFIVPETGSSQVCLPGETQACVCPDDGSPGTQPCRTDQNGWDPCDCTYYTAWCDSVTSLCWQDPQRDAYDYSDPGLTQPDAVRYCEELVFGGYDDWRLPNIDELRSILTGNPDTETGGACTITEGSSMAAMSDLTCRDTTEFGGPALGGCYWNPALGGTCDKPDPAAYGHPLETCSSTVASDNPDWVGSILFDNAAVTFNHLHSYADVRCTRDAPTPPVLCEGGPPESCTPGETRVCSCPGSKTGAQVCTDDGSCWAPCECTGFVASPPITDVCDQCDQVVLTLNLPEELTVVPEQLMTFLYEASTWEFPPQRPPDGGTDYNQVINPDIQFGTPYVTTVPGCTFYRESCLSGDYYLYISLMQSSAMPPTYYEGDYWWGMTQPVPLTLGDGPLETIELDIMLEAYIPPPPTLITLSALTARPLSAAVEIAWSTESEIENAGFNLYRAESKDAEYVRVNPELISAQGSPTKPADYHYVDRNVQNGKTYFYKLEDMDLSGQRTLHGPAKATPRRLYIFR